MMTSFERVLKSLSFQEPDRVPLFLLLTLHGAKELGLSIHDYFSDSENVIEGQLRLRRKFKNDCLYPFYYAALELEAWGAEILFTEDGPPNTTRPLMDDISKIFTIEPPDIVKTPCLQKVLRTIEGLNHKVKKDAPIIGVVMSPFSFPVMQLGFEKYLDLIYFHPKEFNHLIKVNSHFCREWASAQLAAGADAICYFDPLSSPTVIDTKTYMYSGFEITKETIGNIPGPACIHLASGRAQSAIPLLTQTGASMVGVSCLDDMKVLKNECRNKLTVLGNLNGIEMATWDCDITQKNVKNVITNAASGGGFILSDNHGEIPFQVSDEIIHCISETARKWGEYPIKTVNE